MADYKELYLTMMRASEQAVRTLIAAQQMAEEQYLSEPETVLTLLDPSEQMPDGDADKP